MIQKILKRAAAGILSLAMCASLTACYSEENTWAAKMGDDVLPIGGYIYYLTSAYNEAKAQIDTSAQVLKGQVEGENAESWISGRAQDYMRSYYYVSKKFDELGLSLTEEDQETIRSTATTMWSVYGFKTPMEKLGCAEASFNQAYAQYNMKLTKVLAAMYGKGGELEVPEEELHTYYIDNYTYYQYFYVSMSTKNEDGTSSDRSDEEKEELKDKLKEYVEKINSGDQEFGVAEANFSTTTGVETSHNDPVASPVSSMGTLFSDALKDLDVNEAAFVDASSGCYVMQKLDIEEDFKALLEDQNRYDSLLQGIKITEFTDYTIEQGASVDFQVNQKAIDRVKVSAIADAMGKDGSSSASSESSSSTESSSSAESSSSTESGSPAESSSSAESSSESSEEQSSAVESSGESSSEE